MVIEIHQLLGYGKGVAASAIKNFYQQKTNPRSKMIEAIQEWVNKERRKKWRVKLTKIMKMKKIQILIIKIVVIVKVRFLSECPKNR